MATLKQQIDSLYELGKDFKNFNKAVQTISFKIDNADPYEMERVCKEYGSKIAPYSHGNEQRLLTAIMPANQWEITIHIFSFPIALKQQTTWELLEKAEEAVDFNRYEEDIAETRWPSCQEEVLEEALRLQLQPAAETPLTPFTTDMQSDDENEMLHDIIGGIKY